MVNYSELSGSYSIVIHKSACAHASILRIEIIYIGIARGGMSKTTPLAALQLM